jgi:hypothetical protein
MKRVLVPVTVSSAGMSCVAMSSVAVMDNASVEFTMVESAVEVPVVVMMVASKRR